jgi:hypothetical protein
MPQRVSTPTSEGKGYLSLCHEVSTAWIEAGFERQQQGELMVILARCREASLREGYIWSIPTVCLDVISLTASSCGYDSGQIEQLVAH